VARDKKPPVIEVLDTGIYQKEIFHWARATKTQRTKAIKRMKQTGDLMKRDVFFKRAKAEACRIMEKCGAKRVPDDQAAQGANLKTGELFWHKPADFAPIGEDAIDFLFRLDNMEIEEEKLIALCRQGGWSEHHQAQLNPIIMAAIDAGSIFERMTTRWAEQYVKRGVSDLESKVKAAQTTNSRHEEKRSRILPAYEKIRAENPKLKTTALRKQVAKNVGVSARTVYREMRKH
jgi:hypothetical protein